MIVTCVEIFVKRKQLDEFIAITRQNHEGAAAEPGNLRFDVLQAKDDPTRFFLYEAYESEEAAKAHKETPHYLKWKDTVADWMAKPRVGTPYRVLFPQGADRW
jgi:autoinducer 2-degrading protein